MIRISRRAFLGQGVLLLGAAALPAPVFADGKPALRIGLITDIHYAEKPDSPTRFYHGSLAKMKEGVDLFNREKVRFAVELGDLFDSTETAEGDLVFLKKIESEYARFQGDRHYVLGNHDAWTLTKAQFLQNSGAKKEFYSFDQDGFHFVILDACHRSDGVAYGNKNYNWKDSDIPAAQRTWLEADLKQTKNPTIVFVHQRLDGKNNYSVKSAAIVRKILEDSKKVLAVFQGHSHKNDYREINRIHYCTLRAVIEGEGEANSGYAILSIYPDGTLQLKGFRRQSDYDLIRT